MHVSTLTIKNFLSIGEARIENGRVIQIAGQNNQGKTSILKALDFAVHGSNDPSLVKFGEDAAEVMVELSDKTMIRRRLNAEGKQSVTVERDGMRAQQPQALLGALFDQSSFNPLDLLDPKNRTEAILKSLDIRMTPERLAEELGVDKESLPPLDYDAHGLKVVDAAHRYFYQRRAEANKAAAEKKKRWEVNRDGLTPYSEVTLELDPAKVMDAMTRLEVSVQQQRDEISKIDQQLQMALKAEQRVKQYNDELNAIAIEMENLTVKYEKDMAALKARHQQGTNFLKGAIDDVPKDLPSKKPHEDIIRENTEMLAQHRQTLAEIDKARSIKKQHDMVKAMEDEYLKAKAEAEKLDASVVALANSVKDKLMREVEMPIPGLAYDGGSFTIDDTSVDNISSSLAIKLAVGIARKLAKKTKVICIDGIEQLDRANWETFRKEVEGDGFQYFLTKVGEPYEPMNQDDKAVTMSHGQVMQ